MKKPLIYGHRGASGYAPENTLEAYQKAIDLKADGIELDIQLSRDQEIVVCHDETIDRTSSGTGAVRDYTLEELKKFNYNKTHPEYAYAAIPTMREVFELIKPTGLIINIELKTGIVFYQDIEKKILALTDEFDMNDRVIYSSFNHYSARKIHELKHDAKVGFLYADGPIDMPAYARANGADAIHPAVYNLQYANLMSKSREYGLMVNVWTVNTEEQVKLCVEKGVDGIITNYPDQARAWMEKYYHE